jgi:oxygen-independent coproporphyrinogen-3 oxidase
VDSITPYLERMDQHQSPVQECHKLEVEEKIEERFFLGLRRRQGISVAAIRSQFGNSYDEKMGERIREFCDAGWLEESGDQLRLTDRGVLFSNEVFAGLLV